MNGCLLSSTCVCPLFAECAQLYYTCCALQSQERTVPRRDCLAAGGDTIWQGREGEREGRVVERDGGGGEQLPVAGRGAAQAAGEAHLHRASRRQCARGIYAHRLRLEPSEDEAHCARRRRSLSRHGGAAGKAMGKAPR